MNACEKFTQLLVIHSHKRDHELTSTNNVENPKTSRILNSFPAAWRFAPSSRGSGGSLVHGALWRTKGEATRGGRDVEVEPMRAGALLGKPAVSAGGISGCTTARGSSQFQVEKLASREERLCPPWLFEARTLEGGDPSPSPP